MLTCNKKIKSFLIFLVISSGMQMHGMFHSVRRIAPHLVKYHMSLSSQIRTSSRNAAFGAYVFDKQGLFTQADLFSGRTYTPYCPRYKKYQSLLQQRYFGSRDGNKWEGSKQASGQGNRGWFAALLGIYGLAKAYDTFQVDDSKKIFGFNVVLAQENKFFASEALNDLEEFRNSGQRLLWYPGRNDTWYALDYLHVFLTEPIVRDEVYSISNLIKNLSKPEFIEKQNPNFYADVIKAIGRAYDSANSEERASLKEKVEYLFGGNSERDKHFTSELAKALKNMLETSESGSHEHAILNEIGEWAAEASGCQLFPEWKKHLSTISSHDQSVVYSPNETPQFDRQAMVLEDGVKVEGYWASSQDPSKDWYKGKFPYPKKNPQSWATQEEFLRRLGIIEQKASRVSYLGVSQSRFENIHVGNVEYMYTDQKTGEKIHWPEAFGPYYVKKFNVKPSREFYEFVMNYPVADS